MAYKIFVSRTLQKDSPFFTVLSPRWYDIQHESLVSFSPTPFEPISDGEWIFFYSKKGVDFALANSIFKTIVQDKKIACFGQATAHYLLLNYDIKTDFIGNGKAEDTANAFLKLANGQSVIFPQAKQSRQTVEKIIGQQIQALPLVVYDNQIKNKINVKNADYLVFTSPMNVEAYYKKYKIKALQKVIAIGQTTAKKLEELGVSNVWIAAHPSEQGLVDVILNL